MKEIKEPYILVYGTSVYDIFGFTHNDYRSHDSNPGSVKVSFGGVCRNIAENMARLGVNTKLISIVGNDEKGKSIIKHAEDINLDMSNSIVIDGESTPTYMAILDDVGEMVSAIVDMNITDKVTKEHIDSREEIIKGSEYMVLDTDNPQIVEYILNKFEGETKFILDPVSASKVANVKHLINRFHTIKPNRHEAEILCGFRLRCAEDVKRAGKYFLSLGVEKVFISLDEDGMYYNDGKNEGIIKSSDVKVVNVTGAGDSCIAGICYGYMNNLSIKDTLIYSIAMSVITISHEETIYPNMCTDVVESCIKELKWFETCYS